MATPKSANWTNEPNAPEIGHKVPLHEGGLHAYENFQCVCRSCNV
ncbi:HNH endonuclease [Hydrogenophaga taeniospiralis]|nr:HNH endonuclease [Hydrogenophaga taeniospiralis]